ncbi:hypothetical protein AB0P21_20940 [Kribbella sp. NPDC056861]|uniref:hypothetical protein n=1 Tax=Kribbella sp. NPDC056861 TaxID=3154857 RepID=UPI0034338A31
MGIFGSNEELNLSEPGVLVIPTLVSDCVPDVCSEFISWATGGIDERAAQQVVAAVEKLKGSNGWLPLDSLREIGIMDFKNGPLTFLKGMTVGDYPLMGVWASYGTRGKDQRQIRTTVERLLRTQGHAAAATWALIARPNARLDLDFLGSQLRESWHSNVSYVRNKDFVKSFTKWKI